MRHGRSRLQASGYPWGQVAHRRDETSHRARPGRPGRRLHHGGDRGLASPPPVLVSLAAWGWRVLVVVVLVLGVVLLLSRVMLAVVPVAAAMFFTALLHRPAAGLVRLGLPEKVAALLVLVLGGALLGFAAYLTWSRISSQSAQLMAQVNVVAGNLKGLLDRIPGSSGLRVNQLVDGAVSWLQANRLVVVQDVLAVGRVVTDVLTGMVLTVLLTYFFIVDGERMWGWLVRLVPVRTRGSINGAGHRAWGVLAGWIRGSAVIATFHGVVVGTVLWLLGTPLVLPLAILVFIGSFVPIVGALVFGGLALLVTLLTQGPVSAVIFLGVLIIEDQIEAHVLQPFVIGRAVHLHPVTIVLVLVVGGALGGVIGAIAAVPVAAAANAALKYLTGIEDIDGRPLRDEDRFTPLAPPRSAPLAGTDGGGRDVR